MRLKDICGKIPSKLFEVLSSRKIDVLRPCQEKAIEAGLFNCKSMVVCSPTASGKTLVAELACIKNVLEGKGKAVYIVPLKALATEKYKEFKKDFPFLRCGLAIGDMDSKDNYLGKNDLIVVTAEKLDSLIRHKAEWIKEIFTIVVDETHLINDSSRGPTVEILITMLRNLLASYQLIALSATIGNPDVLAEWLDAELVEDNWRPVKLYSGTYLDGRLEFY
ncbi:DEAD/DEAH box helicase [Candidatus Woesearchaeota archaeon]|nr:DEAD/DEAH box helicase [Candidatus Woesearchaeota archaeon]